MASQIEAYGLIGNTHTSALVARRGSIDWLCAPRFDSDACFTALLGYDEHGRWALRPTVKVRESEQRYRDDSMILETEFTCDGGVARVIDFMPMGGRCEIVRIVEGVDGEVPLEMLLDVRFCYGADAPSIEKIGDGTCFLAGQDALILRSPLVLEQASQRVSAYLRVKKGDRFCWLRDATLTLDAFRIGGYIDEARAFRDWLLRAIAGNAADLQIMYNVVGGRHLTELELDWLPGYEGSKPVRVGNAASNQFQLDVYGEVLSCLYSARKMGLPRTMEGWQAVKDLITFVEDAWQRPDDGIWEVRGGRRHFTHSKVMAWVFVDRVMKGIQELG